MKIIQVKMRVDDGKRIETITLEKHGDDEEINVLASGISTIFLKSQEALKIAEKKGKRIVSLGRSKK